MRPVAAWHLTGIYEPLFPADRAAAHSGRVPGQPVSGRLANTRSLCPAATPPVSAADDAQGRALSYSLAQARSSSSEYASASLTPSRRHATARHGLRVMSHARAAPLAVTAAGASRPDAGGGPYYEVSRSPQAEGRRWYHVCSLSRQLLTPAGGRGGSTLGRALRLTRREGEVLNGTGPRSASHIRWRRFVPYHSSYPRCCAHPTIVSYDERD